MAKQKSEHNQYDLNYHGEGLQCINEKLQLQIFSYEPKLYKNLVHKTITAVAKLNITKDDPHQEQISNTQRVSEWRQISHNDERSRQTVV